MLLNQLVKQNDATQSEGAVNDNAEPVSGVVPKGTGEGVEVAAVLSQSSEETPASRADMRTVAMHRFLSAQTDVSEEVLQLYKLVCTGFR